MKRFISILLAISFLTCIVFGFYFMGQGQMLSHQLSNESGCVASVAQVIPCPKEESFALALLIAAFLVALYFSVSYLAQVVVGIINKKFLCYHGYFLDDYLPLALLKERDWLVFHTNSPALT